MSRQLPRFRILWIEDDIDQLTQFVEELKGLLCKPGNIGRPVKTDAVEWGTKAEKALERLKESPPDLIVLDVMLPRTQEAFEAEPLKVDTNAGYMLWHRLRKQKEWGEKLATVPILVLTALSRPLYRPMMEQDGNLKWLDKPVMPSAAAGEIIALVKSSQQSAPPT